MTMQIKRQCKDFRSCTFSFFLVKMSYSKYKICLYFQDVSGKVSIDFKNPHALRVLTKCLLKSDFNIDVCIPEDRLVPTLPLRLNYILWIEDLLNIIQRCDNIRGLDIGKYKEFVYILSYHRTETNLQINKLKEITFKCTAYKQLIVFF